MFLGREKLRCEDAVLTIPDKKLIDGIIAIVGVDDSKRLSDIPGKKQLKDDDAEVLLDEAEACKYRSATGKGIYLSSDRGDVAFAVKELARRMAKP